MFTGIVKGLCSIVGIVDSEGMRQLQVAFEGQVTAEGLEIGASVAINGTCLTVTKFHQHEEGGHGVVVSFDCIQETLSRTNLGRLVLGDRVNVERAMRYGDEVGGHHVSGHIDCVGRISQIVASPNNREVFVQFPDSKVRKTRKKRKRKNIYIFLKK
jgi:riboflavin synthase